MKVTIFALLILFTTSLFAQSKKELNLRIDSLQTEINSEKQVVQNLTLQIQNLTTELEKINKTMLLLTSQVVKQDSMNTFISNGIIIVNNKITGIQRLQDSIKNSELAKSKEVITPKANLKMKLFSQYVNEKGKLLITEMTKLSAPENYYFLCYDNTSEFTKIQIEGIGENISITLKDLSLDEGRIIYFKTDIKINGMFIISNKDIKIDMGSNIVITVIQGETIIIEETVRSIGCM